jgi:hypothetical protein
MQAFLVRPVMTGLLALIIAGLCGFGHSGAPLGFGQSCHSVAAASGAGGAMHRHSAHC